MTNYLFIYLFIFCFYFFLNKKKGSPTRLISAYSDSYHPYLTTSQIYPQITFDLRNSYTLCKFVITARKDECTLADYPAAFVLSGSNDNVNYYQVYRTDNEGVFTTSETKRSYYITYSSTAYRFYQLKMLSSYACSLTQDTCSIARCSANETRLGISQVSFFSYANNDWRLIAKNARIQGATLQTNTSFYPLSVGSFSKVKISYAGGKGVSCAGCCGKTKQKNFFFLF